MSDTNGQRQRLDALTQVEQRHHAVTVKLDRGYEDYVSGRIRVSVVQPSLLEIDAIAAQGDGCSATCS